MLTIAYRRTHDVLYADFYEDPEREGEFKPYELQDFADWRPNRGNLHCVTALTPKSVWEQIGGYDESLPAWEDWDFQLKTADAGICSRRIAAPLWVYRKHTGQRARQNIADFETSKRAILDKWRPLFQEGKTLMACQSCSGRQTLKPNTQQTTSATAIAKAQAKDPESAMVEYIGERRGNVQYRGTSGTFYIFSSGAKRLVLGGDLKLFEGRQDFRIVRTEPVEPELVAG